MVKFRRAALIVITSLVVVIAVLVVTGAWEWLFYPGSRVDGLGSMMSPANCA